MSISRAKIQQSRGISAVVLDVMVEGLNDLTEEELITLLTLLKLLAASDGHVSEGEALELRAFADVVTPERYDELSSKLDVLALDVPGLRRLAQGIHRQPARELIYANLLELAVDGTITEIEREHLDWLTETWSLESLHGEA